MSSRHKELFEQYVVELRAAKELATAWWEQLWAVETLQTKSAAEAENSLDFRWPYGPASHPFVIATFRKYFIACERINDELEPNADDATESDEQEDEDDWGGDAAEPEEHAESNGLWDGDEPMDPAIVLIEALSGRHDDLSEFMELYVFACIGEENGHSV